MQQVIVRGVEQLTWLAKLKANVASVICGWDWVWVAVGLFWCVFVFGFGKKKKRKIQCSYKRPVIKVIVGWSELQCNHLSVTPVGLLEQLLCYTCGSIK